MLTRGRVKVRAAMTPSQLDRLLTLWPSEFPEPLLGSYRMHGLDDTVCFDRRGRYGPYGLGSNGSSATTIETESNYDDLEWNNVSWGSLQKRCTSDNWNELKPAAENDESKGTLHRSAVLIRTWDSYEYKENDLQAIRSLVSELSLQSRGQYEVFLFVHVKNSSLPIWTDQQIYNDVLRRSVPQEFRDMAVLWNEAQCAQAYPLTGTNE
jgi:hypothetical protein